MRRLDRDDIRRALAISASVVMCFGLASPAALRGQSSPRITVPPFEMLAVGGSGANPAALAAAIRVTLIVEFMDGGFEVVERSVLGPLLRERSPDGSADDLDVVGAAAWLLRPQAVMIAGAFRIELMLLEAESRTVVSSKQGRGDAANMHQIVLGLVSAPDAAIGSAPSPSPDVASDGAFLPLHQFEAFGEAVTLLEQGAVDQALVLLEEIVAEFPGFAPARRLLEGARRLEVRVSRSVRETQEAATIEAVEVLGFF